MHVSCRNRAIVDVNLSSVFATDEERGALAAVKSLDLGENEITRIQGLQPFCSLTALDLSRNKLASLKGLPLGLVKLNVSHNQITSLEGAHMLPHLAEIDASYNKLADVRGLPRAAALQTVKLSHNRIPSAAGLEGLEQLQTLELDNNYICLTEDLRPLGSCVELRRLTMRGNPCADHSSFKVAVAGIIASLQFLDGAAVTTKRVGTVRRSASPWNIAASPRAGRTTTTADATGTSQNRSGSSKVSRPGTAGRRTASRGGYSDATNTTLPRRGAARDAGPTTPRGQLPSPRLLHRSPHQTGARGGRGGANPNRSLNSSINADRDTSAFMAALNTSGVPAGGGGGVFATLPQGEVGMVDASERFDDPRLAHAGAPPQQPEPYILSRGMEVRGGTARVMQAMNTTGFSADDAAVATQPGDATADEVGMAAAAPTPHAHTPGRGAPQGTPAARGATPGRTRSTAASPRQPAAAPASVAAQGIVGMPTKVADLQRLLDDEHRLTATLQKQKRKLEAELSDVRRVLADELAKLSATKEENAKLRKENEDWRGKCEKHQREYKYAHLKLTEVKLRHQEELEMMKTQHGAAVNELKTKLKHAVVEDASAGYMDWQMERVKLMDYVTQLEEQNSTLIQQSQYHAQSASQSHATTPGHAYPPDASAITQQGRGVAPPAMPAPHGGGQPQVFLDQPSTSEGEGWSEPGDDTAQQIQFAVGLKKWLLQELEKSGGAAAGVPGAGAGGSGGDRVPNPARGAPHVSPANIEQLWSHNLSLLQQGASAGGSPHTHDGAR